MLWLVYKQFGKRLMQSAIKVSHLSKEFSVHLKQKGLMNSLKALVSRKYETIQAVDDISFEIFKGELVGFIGPNGAGKTTTLKMLSGLIYPSLGAIQVAGHVPFKREKPFLHQFSLVMGQKNQLFWDLPPIETFELNRKIYAIPKPAYQKILLELTELLDAGKIIRQQVRELSLGQRMKCELIASLLHTPQILFLDEPTIGLDVVMQAHLRGFIQAYNHKYGATIVLTSHYMRDVQELCDRILVIDHGRLIYDGGLKQVVKKYTRDKRILLSFSKPVARADLERYGKVVAHEPLRATLEVCREDIPQATSQLLQHLPVEDIDVSEVPIEDVIQYLFSNNGI
jgi:ABC-2 type transport system ATP-binding protein